MGAVVSLAWLALACVGPLALAVVGPQRREDGDGLAALERELGARHPKTRRGAVRALAELGSPTAWRLVARALDDPESEVGDEAELRIAHVTDASVRDELFGPLGVDSKSERVRLRVAEALGRMDGPLEARDLARAIDARDTETARLVLWSVERLARRSALVGDRIALLQRVETLARAASEGGLRAAALAALAELEFARAERLFASAWKARQPEVRVAVLALGARSSDPEVRERLAEALRDPAASVRTAAIGALEALADRGAAAVLVELLEREARPRVAERAVGALQRLSGLKARRDPRPWRDWCSHLAPDWKPTPRPAESEDQRATTSAANFGGLSILSDRLSFLVDFSGSMWAPRDDGRSVKSVVDERFAAGVAGLVPEARFNVIPYANEPLAWETELADAKPANRKRALEFFVACKARGRGNFHAAVLAALADEDVDTLMVWSDGVPTGGLHSNLELVVPLLVERNRFRQVALDLILVDAPKGSAARLGELARSSGGRALAVSLDDFAGVRKQDE